MASDDTEITFDSERVVRFLDTVTFRLAAIKDRDATFAKLVSPTIFQDIIYHFEIEQGPTGPWKKWSKSYTYAIAKGWARKPGKKLQDTGRLRNSFRPTNFRKTNLGYEWYNPAKTKTGFPYAYAHDTGGPKLPQRSFMWLSNDAMDKIVQIAFGFLLGNK